MSMQEFLRTLNTVRRASLPKLKLKSNFQDPNHEIANTIFKTIITTGTKTDTSFLSNLNPTTLNFILSNPQLKTHKCFDFFNFLLQNQSLIPFKLDLQAHLTLICRLLEARKFADAEFLLKSVSVNEDGRYPFSDIASSIEDCFENVEDDDGSEKIFAKLFNLILKVYSDNGMYSDVLETFDYMKNNEIQIDERTCTLHLIALKWSDQVGVALDFFYRMIDVGIEVSVYSLTVVVDGLCKNGEIKRGRELVEEMISEGIKPNLITFNILINACSKRWNFEELDSILVLMEKERVAYSISTYKLLIEGFLSSGKIKEVNKMVSEMHDKGLKLDVYFYTLIINGYCRMGEMEHAFSLFDKMTQRGINPSADAYTGLINGICKAGHMEAAKPLVNEMRNKGIELDEAMSNALINGYCKKGLMNEALELHVAMDNKGLTTYVSVYNLMLSGLCKLNRTDEAKNILNMMVKKGISSKMATSVTSNDGEGS